MVCLGLEPGAAGWLVQTNSLRYGGTHDSQLLHFLILEAIAKMFVIQDLRRLTLIGYYLEVVL